MHGLRAHSGRGGGKDEEQKDGENSAEVCFLHRTWSHSHKLTAAMVTCTQCAQDGVHQHSRMDRGGISPLLGKGLVASNGC